MTGVDVVANVKAETDTTMTLDEALVLHVEPNMESMRQMLYLYPWVTQTLVEDSSQEVTIYKHTIMFITEISEEMFDYHKSMWISIRKDEKEAKEEEAEEMKKERDEKVLTLFTKAKKAPKTPVH
jgi:hypothetical protein